MSSEVALREQRQLVRRDPIRVGDTLARSGYFQDAKEAAQAAVKVMAGEELGLGPIAAMTGIHIVKGKVTLSANLIAGLIKRSGRYDFRVKRLDGEGCEIAFYESGEEVGVSSFVRKDAEAAGLWGQAGPWKQHTRNMFYARAMSNGAKWYCPDVFAGPVYTPDELGVEVDGETGEVIEPTPVAIAAPAVNVDELARELIAVAGDAKALAEAMKSAGLSREDLADPEKLLVAQRIANQVAAGEPEVIDGQESLDVGPEPRQEDKG